MKLCLRRVGCAAALAALALTACGKRDDKGKPGPAPASSVDTSADRARARESWVVGVARDSGALLALAQSNSGWPKLFTSDPAAALGEFGGALKSGNPPSGVRTGAARAALDLSEAHAAIGAIVVNATGALLDVKTDAGGPEAAAWRQAFLARRLLHEGKDAAPTLAKIAADSPLQSYAAALKPGATGPLAALLTRKAGADGATLPAGATAEYKERLEISAAIEAGKTAEAIARFAKVAPTAPDVTVGTGESAVTLRDPGLVDLGAHVAALQVLDAVGPGAGWLGLLKARAELALGRAAAAKATLEALKAAPPATAELADLVLTDALSVEDLKWETVALLARAQAAAGDAAGAKATAATLPADTIGHRVLKTWAAVSAGEPLDASAFPEDRSLLARAIAAEVDALGADGKGVPDVAALSLVDRYVDAVERRFAEAAALSGAPELALKHLENAEDKAAAFAPSPRNQLSALARAARENARIGRPRIALKYLSRLAERFPAVAAPSDMLRDLLTIRAMDQEGGAASGQ